MTITPDKNGQLSVRDDRLDKARIVLIWLVVFGHMVELLLGAHPVFNGLYLYIYSLHMPAFVMLAGMTSRAELSPKAWSSLRSKIIFPLILFIILYEAFYLIISGRVSFYLLRVAPHWILWFLLSLLLWRLILPIILKFRYPIILSLFLTIFAGLFDLINITFSLSRTFYFLPFFLMGHSLYTGRLSWDFNAVMRWLSPPLALAWMLALGGILYWLSPVITPDMLYGSKPYSHLGPDIIKMMALRMTMLLLSTISALTLIRLTASLPQLPAINAQNTLWIYLWHGFALIIAQRIISLSGGIGPISNAFTLILIAGLAVIAWALCCALSRGFVARGSQHLVARTEALRNRLARG